jgi:L-ascorbate metabolism protein UlaG (beta-lactamase superfamily)
MPVIKKKANVVTESHNAKDHNNISAVTSRQHVVDGPGEYEMGGVFITGIATFDEAKQSRNVLYVFDFNGLTVAHLGDMQQVPTQKQIEALEQVNILLVPVGAGRSLNAAQAAELVSMLEPNIVVPMHYKLPGLNLDLETVDRFLKEMGVTDVKEETSLKVTISGLPEETETVILLPKV